MPTVCNRTVHTIGIIPARQSRGPFLLLWLKVEVGSWPEVFLLKVLRCRSGLCMLARFLRLPSSLRSNKMSLQNEKRKINYAEVITVSSFLGPDHLVAGDFFHFVIFPPILLVNSNVFLLIMWHLGLIGLGWSISYLKVHN